MSDEIFIYFVSYTFFTKSGRSGVGMVRLTRSCEIKTFKDVLSMAEFLKKDNPGHEEMETIVIQNWIRLEDWDEGKYDDENKKPDDESRDAENYSSAGMTLVTEDGDE